MIQTLEQERAKYAYEKVCSVSTNSKYKPLVKGFSTMIMNNGLGQALAFLKAKGDNHHISLYNHINGWFNSDKCKINLNENGDTRDDLLSAIQNHSSEKYRYYTQETLDLINWLRKFVDAEIEGD
jgi:CRISPR-associated protein Cmr5